MKIGIRNFRCFQDIPLVDIRPITLLVGENSTGKTSFLSALRFAHELFQRGTNPSFNKDSYSLGSFKEIAHYRGGRAGRADEVTFFCRFRSVRDAFGLMAILKRLSAMRLFAQYFEKLIRNHPYQHWSTLGAN